MTRRKFLTTTRAAVGAPMLAAMVGVSQPSVAADAVISDAELVRQMTAKLTAELNDAAVANVVQPYLLDIFLTWDLAPFPAAQADTIVAYGFGNRSAAGSAAGSAVPGPVNEAIADAVHQLYVRKPARVFAQWEVANVLTSSYQISATHLRALPAPAVAGNGAIANPTLDAAAAAIVALAGTATAMGRVAVVTHRDLAKRALQASKAVGMNAGTAQEITLPVAYDVQAAQTAYRRRDLYLLNDMTQQLATLRLDLIAKAYPNG